MRVLHVGPAPHLGQGNGVDIAAWPLMTAQVEAGATVFALAHHEVPHAELAHAEATRAGIRFAGYPRQRFETLTARSLEFAQDARPDIVHFHSVFVPANAQLARHLRKSGIPYVISPHGGLNLWRGQLKKDIYGALIEKPYFTAAQTIFTLTDREQKVVTSWLRKKRLTRYVELPNSIPALPPDTPLWEMPATPRLIFLGRFDVVKKGLDRLMSVAALMPGVEVIAYGSASPAEQPAYSALLKRGVPANMSFHSVVRNAEKDQAFTSATMYLQLSRDEGFGMAIIEAMRLGVPVAMTRGCDLSETVEKNDLGAILPDDPSAAADVLAGHLADPAQLRHWSRAGLTWTADTLAPKRIAEISLAAYEDVFGSYRD